MSWQKMQSRHLKTIDCEQKDDRCWGVWEIRCEDADTIYRVLTLDGDEQPIDGGDPKDFSTAAQAINRAQRLASVWDHTCDDCDTTTDELPQYFRGKWHCAGCIDPTPNEPETAESDGCGGPDQDVRYRRDMIDAGRGGLLRK